MGKEILIKLASDPIIWSVILAFVLWLAGWIVKKTKTEKDDQMLKVVMGFIYNAFNHAEKMIPDATTGNLGKVDIAMRKFLEDYQRRFGTDAPQSAIDQAKAEWSILATEIKKAKS